VNIDDSLIACFFTFICHTFILLFLNTNCCLKYYYSCSRVHHHRIKTIVFILIISLSLICLGNAAHYIFYSFFSAFSLSVAQWAFATWYFIREVQPKRITLWIGTWKNNWPHSCSFRVNWKIVVSQSVVRFIFFFFSFIELQSRVNG